MKVGDIITGTVDEITSYGAFLDIGTEYRPLLHITDIAWRRVRHPTDLVSLDETLTVKVLKIDPEHSRASVSLKHMTNDPWDGVEIRHPIGTSIVGVITHIADYGLFVRINDDGIEGMIHVNLLHKKEHKISEYSVGDIIEVVPIGWTLGSHRLELSLS